MSNLIVPKEMVDRFLIRNESIELMRISKDGIWVNPDIPIDEVAQRVFAVLEPMIIKAYLGAERTRVAATEAPL